MSQQAPQAPQAPLYALISGNANRELSRKIAAHIELELTSCSIHRFADDEIFVEIQENVRGVHVFIIQPTNCPSNDNLMELLIMIDAARRGSARTITAVVPYFGYARQDRKTGPRTPISARLVANLLETAGASRILTLDLHSGQIQGFFDIPTDNLFAAPYFARDIRRLTACSNPLIVSPDVGGVVRARALASRLGADMAIIDKRRSRPGEAEVMNVIGSVRARHCILVDDIVDSAGTLCSAAEALLAHGAHSVRAYATHGVLSPGKGAAGVSSLEKIARSPLTELVITDSITPGRAELQCDKLRILSVSPLLGDAIRNIATSRSVSTLFD